MEAVCEGYGSIQLDERLKFRQYLWLSIIVIIVAFINAYGKVGVFKNHASE